MAWTTPRTWTTGEIVTAALLNAQIKGNSDLAAAAIMTTAGDIIYASAANTPARLAKSTTSTQYLANTGTSNVPAWNEVALATGVSGTLPVANGGTGITSLGSNVATFLGTPSSANLRSALTDETGTGAAVFATSPTLVTPALGTPGSGVLTSCTGLPEAGLAVSNSPTNGYMLTAQSGDAGGMTWAAAASGGIAAVVDDTSPQLGGNLDMQARLLVGNGGSTGIAIDSVGAVNMAAQPAFLAVLETADNNVTGGGTVYTLGGGNALVDIFDQGGDFATATFTAPITGRYLLSFSMRLGQGTTSMTLQEANIITSNRIYRYRNDLALGGVLNSQAYGTVVADMDLNDTVTVTLTMSGATDVVDVESNAAATHFAGVLLV